MITVSTKSWHYKLLKAFNKYPRSLCAYVRAVVVCSFVTATFAALFIGMTAGLVYVPFLLFKVFAVPERGTLLHLLIPFGVVAWFLVIIIGGGFVGDVAQKKYRRWKWDRLADRVTNQEEPSLLSSWLKAKKEKVCPMIEYKD